MSDVGFGPVGDPPIIQGGTHYYAEDDYGRTTPLVDRRLLEQAQARIQDWRNKVSGALGVRPGEMNYTTEEAVAKIEDLAHWKDANYATSCRLLSELTEVRKVLKAEPERECNTADAARRVIAERDHWRAEAEKARTRCSQLMHDIAETDDATVTPDETVGPDQRFSVTIDIPGDLRRAADIIDAWVGPHDAVTADGLRAHASHLESEATADDVVEKAARILAEAAHDDWDFIVQRSQDREAAVTRAIRDRYLDTARAVAGLLRGGRPIMHLCAICGNKRCPKASWHGYRCGGSNATNQVARLEPGMEDES